MATPRRPYDRPEDRSEAARGPDEGDLDRRKRMLDADLSAVRIDDLEREGSRPRAGGMTGFGQALKLSSEFIAAVGVGVAIGLAIDHVAGTSPWGLILFLLLGFVAGVLNVLRSAGLVAQAGTRIPDAGPGANKDRDGGEA